MTITNAMVLAAGFGTRMRPLTDTVPKPLVELGGRALLDHVLDRLADAAIDRAVVNVHYMAEQIVTHTASRVHPRVVISDERDGALDTGGGVRRALPELGHAPFLVHNSDSVWIEGAGVQNLTRLITAWDPAQMAALLLLAARESSIGYDNHGDFELDTGGRLHRRQTGAKVPYVFAGVSILKPELFDGIDRDKFSLNAVFDKAASAGQLFGCVLDGIWMHVGTPDALKEAESLLYECRRGKTGV